MRLPFAGSRGGGGGHETEGGKTTGSGDENGRTRKTNRCSVAILAQAQRSFCPRSAVVRGAITAPLYHSSALLGGMADGSDADVAGAAAPAEETEAVETEAAAQEVGATNEGADADIAAKASDAEESKPSRDRGGSRDGDHG